jgi:DNA-binding HxlR family transcriptional regulator
LADTHKSVRGPQVSPDCKAVAETLALIGDKWTVLVVGVLSSQTLRYSEIRRAVDGISQRMLTLTLKRLEEEGLVERTMYPTIPPRVDYSLTELGRTLTVPLRTLFDWTLEHRPAMLKARKTYAAAAKQRARASRAGVGE